MYVCLHVWHIKQGYKGCMGWDFGLWRKLQTVSPDSPAGHLENQCMLFRSFEVIVKSLGLKQVRIGLDVVTDPKLAPPRTTGVWGIDMLLDAEYWGSCKLVASWNAESYQEYTCVGTTLYRVGGTWLPGINCDVLGIWVPVKFRS